MVSRSGYAGSLKWTAGQMSVSKNLSPNRGQALGGSRVGPSNASSALALVPAALFGFPATAAFAVAGYYAVSNQLFPESQYGKAKTR
jgi:hypothetical protein